MGYRNKIDLIKKRLIKEISPESIYIFGSYAHGTENPDSDLDFLVIWDTPLPAHKRNVLLSGFFSDRNFPLDIFAFTRKEAEAFRDIPGSMVYEAVQNGKMIYGQ
ncbi:nucleotidyltransferase domain-containing protein [bacterium]|nr:nucleotidyltransferase domain-containing protein [bacterium]